MNFEDSMTEAVFQISIRASWQAEQDKKWNEQTLPGRDLTSQYRGMKEEEYYQLFPQSLTGVYNG